MTDHARCSCPTKFDEHSRAVVRANTDQLCPVHGHRKQELPHCATCTCGVGSKIVQEPRCNHSGGFVEFNATGDRVCSICKGPVKLKEEGRG